MENDKNTGKGNDEFEHKVVPRNSGRQSKKTPNEDALEKEKRAKESKGKTALAKTGDNEDINNEGNLLFALAITDPGFLNDDTFASVLDPNNYNEAHQGKYFSKVKSGGRSRTKIIRGSWNLKYYLS